MKSSKEKFKSSIFLYVTLESEYSVVQKRFLPILGSKLSGIL